MSKGICEDASEYSSDIHVLLLIENNSGKTLLIDDVYDTLSVNGFSYERKVKNEKTTLDMQDEKYKDFDEPNVKIKYE